MMNWNAIGAIGEILGAVAVVVTLIYLSIQLRQNSLQIRIASSQTAVSNYSGNIIDVLSDVDRLDLFRRGLASFSGLGLDDQARFHAIMLGFHTSFLQNLQLRDERVISEALFDSWAQDWASILKCPGAREWWSRFKGTTDEQLRSQVEALTARSDRRPLNEAVAFLRVAAETDG
jgi:hypothetical protein